ncbi:hypothetical protein T02_10814 [Trichinella nativa]|uniref:Uncharacterized protein n=1 Tax=Trichinella nativa TaxID=6335 RepID=A0A0V1LBS2_9BILA|nr:hypothetical protein T02_10814 [Trichinella nativa]
MISDADIIATELKCFLTFTTQLYGHFYPIEKKNRKHILEKSQLKLGTEKNHFNMLISKSPKRKLQSKRQIREKRMLCPSF